MKRLNLLFQIITVMEFDVLASSSLVFPMYLLTVLIPDCFGGGDIKLIAVAGFLLGWKLNTACVLLYL